MYLGPKFKELAWYLLMSVHVFKSSSACRKATLLPPSSTFFLPVSNHKMFPRNAATCVKCYQVFCCKNHRKNHENKCCAQGLTPKSKAIPTCEREPRPRPQKKAEPRKGVGSKLNNKRKFDQIDHFPRPIGVVTAIHAPANCRKMLIAVRRKAFARTSMVPSLPSLKEEDEESVQEQPNKITEEHSAKIGRKNLVDAYRDFKRGSLPCSPIASPVVRVGSASSPTTDSESTPLPEYSVTPVEAVATPLTFLVPRPPHKAKLAEGFKTSTPKDDDEKQETHKTEGTNEQNSSIPPQRPHTIECLTDSIDESPISSKSAVEEMIVPGNLNKDTFLVNAVPPFNPSTPMTTEAPPVRPCNLMEGIETSSADQLEEPQGPSSARVARTFVVGDLLRSSHSTASYSTPFTGKKKKVSWASDTYDAATPYYSARSHFSLCTTPVTPLQNPSLFISVKEVFKNFVCRMPGTLDEESPVKKRLKLVAESKIKCRPTYKGRYPKSRSYLVFNDE